MRGAAGRSLLVALAVAGTRAGAATFDGAVITNVACATMSAVTGPYSVSYCATLTVTVRNPCITLLKVAQPAQAAPGSVVTFTLWVMNCSAWASAFNVCLTDALPANVSYLGPSSSWNGGSGGSWTPVEPPTGQVAPSTLRFCLDILGPSRSAFAQWRATVL